MPKHPGFYFGKYDERMPYSRPLLQLFRVRPDSKHYMTLSNVKVNKLLFHIRAFLVGKFLLLSGKVSRVDMRRWNK